MIKSYWFKLDGDIIVDAIEYQYEGYTPAELYEEYLPVGINAGWYRWDGTAYHFDQALYDAATELLIELETDA